MNERQGFEIWSNRPALFGLDSNRLGTQIDGFGQTVELDWDPRNDLFWITFEDEAAFRRHWRA